MFTKKLFRPSSPLTIKPVMERQGAAMKYQYGNGDSPLEGYVIRRGVGIGGFGEVYFAESDSGKEVALKRIQKNLDVEMRGVRHCLNLRHSNLVAIYDIRYDDDQQGWIVMEFIEGESLRDHLDRSTDPAAGPIHSFEQGKAERVLPVFAQIAAGMTYLHDQGIVHRDLKPANIFLEKGLAKIGDYGLSKYISASRRAGQTESVGTFHYMAPEIGKGEYGKEIDVYSMGIILYEMLTGTVPFDGESTQEILLKHLTADPDLSMLPPGLDHVIGKCLAKNPASRYRDGRDLLYDLGYELTAAGFVAPRYANNKASGTASFMGSNGSAQASQGASSGPSKAASIKDPGFGNDAQASARKPLSSSERINAFFSIGIDGHRAMLEREPVYLQIRALWRNLSKPKGFSGSSDSGSSDSGAWIVAAIVIVAMLTFAGVTTVLGSLLVVYAVYYSLWFFSHVTAEDLRSSSSARANKTAALQETAAYPTATIRPQVATPQPVPGVRKLSKPISTKEAKRVWKVQQQQNLAQRDVWNSSHAWLQSLTFSGLIATVASIAGGFVAVSNGYLSAGSGLWNSQALSVIGWLGTMSILCSWTVVTFARRWESKQEDSIAFRFAMMVAGLLLGAVSFQLSEFLLIPWSSILNPNSDLQSKIFNNTFNRSLKGFYDEQQLPTLAGHMAYFAGLMWIVRWWRQSDSLRKKKFSLWAIVWSMLMAGLVQAVFYFPSPWCLWMAAITSLSVQIASPWIDPLQPQLGQPQLGQPDYRGNDARA
ncbi:MAG: serine/threonine-protein kinase [Planctomycetota bacterium]